MNLLSVIWGEVWTLRGGVEILAWVVTGLWEDGLMSLKLRFSHENSSYLV